MAGYSPAEVRGDRQRAPPAGPGAGQERISHKPAGHGPGHAKHECNNFPQLSDFPTPSSAPILSAPASVMSAYRVAGG